MTHVDDAALSTRDDTTAPAAEPSPAGSPESGAARSRRPLPWIAGGVVALLLLVGIPLGAWMASETALSDAANADAARLTTAIDAAEDASDAFSATAESAHEYAATTAVPIRDTIAGNVGEFDQASSDAVAGAITALTTAATSPRDRDTADGEAVDGDAHGEAFGIQLGFISGNTVAADELRAHYASLGDEARADARAELADEAARFDALADTFRTAETEIRAAVDASDAAIVAAASIGATTGTATLGSFSYASADSTAALQAAVDELTALAATELPLSWDTRTEAAATFERLTTAVGGYVGAAGAARTSESDNTPGSEPNNGAGYACMKWGLFVTYIDTCY